MTPPTLYVFKVKSEELKDSPARMVNGATEVIIDEVGLVKFKSYAMETSPAEVKEEGRLLVKAVCETEKMVEPLSVIFKRFTPWAYCPVFILSKSPVFAIRVDPEGDQSILASCPVKVVLVRVEETFKRLPDVKVLPVVANCNNLP